MTIAACQYIETEIPKVFGHMIHVFQLSFFEAAVHCCVLFRWDVLLLASLFLSFQLPPTHCYSANRFRVRSVCTPKMSLVSLYGGKSICVISAPSDRWWRKPSEWMSFSQRKCIQDRRRLLAVCPCFFIDDYWWINYWWMPTRLDFRYVKTGQPPNHSLIFINKNAMKSSKRNMSLLLEG